MPADEAFGAVPGHGERHQRHGQGQARPESPRHVGELGIRGFLRRGRHRLERHAAERTGARPGPPHLRMHRTGPDHSGFRRRSGRRGHASRARVSADVRAKYFSGSALNFARHEARKNSTYGPQLLTRRRHSPDRPPCRTPDRSRDPRIPPFAAWGCAEERPRCRPSDYASLPLRVLACLMRSLPHVESRDRSPCRWRSRQTLHLRASKSRRVR